MEKMNHLRDLLKHEIEDLYSVEEQIIEALPAMIDKAANKTLKASLSDHLKVTQTQKDRLDKVHEILNEGQPEENKKKGFLSNLFGGGKHKCKGMEGIIDEGKKVMATDMNVEVLDAAIIACTQKIEHYEICGYGTARSYARELNLPQVATLLEQTLNEEYAADDKLTLLAESRINKEAETAGEASASSRPRDGKRSGENVPSKKMEMELVSNRRSSSPTKKSNSAEGGGSPKLTATPRSNSSRGAVTSSKKETGNGRTVKTPANKSSASSSKPFSGRGSTSGTGRSR